MRSRLGCGISARQGGRILISTYKGVFRVNKILVVVFNAESQAFEGLSALKDLHRDGDISLYATMVLSKDAQGQVAAKQALDKTASGTGYGLLLGSLAGVLAGPAGLLLGASLGSLTGMLFDLNRAGIDVQFISDVSQALSPGKTALLADMDENWMVPVDTRMQALGGVVFRRLRSEVVEDQMAREAAASHAEVQRLKEELSAAAEKDKAAIAQHLDAARNKLKLMQGVVDARLSQTRQDAEAKVSALEEQIKTSSERRKAKIEKRITDIKNDLESRHSKLTQAGALIKEAVSG